MKIISRKQVAAYQPLSMTLNTISVQNLHSNSYSSARFYRVLIDPALINWTKTAHSKKIFTSEVSSRQTQLIERKPSRLRSYFLYHASIRSGSSSFSGRASARLFSFICSTFTITTQTPVQNTNYLYLTNIKIENTCPS